jgi:hypothetical protein
MKKDTSLEYLSFQKMFFLLVLMIITLLLFIYKLHFQPTYIVISDKQTVAEHPPPRFHINIVYFANLFVNRTHGLLLIEKQMKDLVATGLLDVSTLHIVLSVPVKFNPTIKQRVYESAAFLPSHNVIFHINNEDCHEYPGIQLVHALASANNSPNHYLLYFHSKGITRFRGERELVERNLHKTVIAPWKHVLEIFETHPTIDKIGSSASDAGWIWWNYWWARASYLFHVEIPIKTERRYYYEDWLSRYVKDPLKDIYHQTNKNCWSLSAPKKHVGIGYTIKEAVSLLVNPSKTQRSK